MTHKIESRPPTHPTTSSGNVDMSHRPVVEVGGNYMRINKILNPSFTVPIDMPTSPPLPAPETTIEEHEDASAISTSQADIQSSSNLPISVKDKEITAAIGDHQGSPPVRYWPHEFEQIMSKLPPSKRIQLEKAYEQFDIIPRRSTDKLIADTPEWVPYVNKKMQTRLKGFRTFHYSFSYRGEKRVVSWDNAFGLVRLTPFFKAISSKKTLARKTLTSTDNLLDLSFNNTGGNISRQGYWVPYECARALCLTFCYPIRWALVPLFGYDFVEECVSDKSPIFKQYEIDFHLVEIAVRKAKAYLETTAYKQIRADVRETKERMMKEASMQKAKAKAQDSHGADIEADSDDTEDNDDTDNDDDDGDYQEVLDCRIHTAKSGVVKTRTGQQSQHQKRKHQALNNGYQIQETKYSQPNEPTLKLQDPVNLVIQGPIDYLHRSSIVTESAEVSPRTKPSNLASSALGWTSINAATLAQRKVVDRPEPLTQSLQSCPPGLPPRGFRAQVLSRPAPMARMAKADGHDTKRRKYLKDIQVQSHDHYRKDDSPSHSESDDQDIVIPEKRKRKDPIPSFTGLPVTSEDEEAAEILLMMTHQGSNDNISKMKVA